MFGEMYKSFINISMTEWAYISEGIILTKLYENTNKYFKNHMESTHSLKWLIPLVVALMCFCITVFVTISETIHKALMKHILNML